MLERKEVIGIAPTGSGKSLAFILPLIHLLSVEEKSKLRAIIVAPTKELARQLFREFVYHA
jgi:ATP-dependent RNA helicase DDX52/ROK1